MVFSRALYGRFFNRTVSRGLNLFGLSARPVASDQNVLQRDACSFDIPKVDADGSRGVDIACVNGNE